MFLKHIGNNWCKGVRALTGISRRCIIARSEIEKVNKLISSFIDLHIRPPRHQYSLDSLDPPSDILHRGKKFIREDMQIESSDSLLMETTLYKFDTKHEDHGCAIFLHDSGGNRKDVLPYLPFLGAAGIQVLAYDICGCGRSEGKYISLGYKESKDIYKITEYLENENISRIALIGKSQGATSALLASAPCNNTSNTKFKGIILDSPITSFSNLLELQLESYFPDYSKEMNISIKYILKSEYDIDIDLINPLAIIGEHRIPALFLHGEGDTLVPPAFTKQLYEGYVASKEIIIMPGLDHNHKRPLDVYSYITTFLLNLFQDN